MEQPTKEVIALHNYPEYGVQVQRLHEPGAEQPHQVLVVTERQGVEKRQLTSYGPKGEGNADAEFWHFDEAKAEKFVDSLNRFLNTKKGRVLAADDEA